MKKFMDENFLLQNETAKNLFHNYAKDLPIIDFHCHVDPKEIALDKQFDNITQLWLYGDHYKWRMMRWCGIGENYITGNASDREKFDAFAAALPLAAGNPLYHWTHLELQRYFGCNTPLSPDTADEIWECTRGKIKQDMSVKSIISSSNVEVICTTDDPADSLEWHKKIAADSSFKTKVLPGFRPDKALSITKPDFKSYINSLGEIKCIDDLYAALSKCLQHFIDNGCIVADHGLDNIPYAVDISAADKIFKAAMAGESISKAEAEIYQTAILLFLAAQYKKHDIVMQLHYGAQRNVNSSAFDLLGADTGYDCIDTPNSSRSLTGLLSALAQNYSLPKTILYSLNPNDNSLLACIAGAFQQEGIKGLVQHGSAWWFNDTKTGIESQLTNLANIGVLGAFVGMLTDSRSFLSYTRHEYFRRILCNLIGTWIENGEYPTGKIAEKLVHDISYGNAKGYFKG